MKLPATDRAMKLDADAMEAAKAAFLETVQVTLVSFNLTGALENAIRAYFAALSLGDKP